MINASIDNLDTICRNYSYSQKKKTTELNDCVFLPE